MSITQFLGPNAVAGTFGDNAYQRARAAGLSDAQINQQVAAAGLSRMSNAQIQQTPAWQARQSAAPPPPAQSTSISRFLGPNATPGFFGGSALQRARDSGLSDEQIQQQVSDAGLKLAPDVSRSIFESAVGGYKRQIDSQLAEYKRQLDGEFETKLNERLSSYQSQAMQLQSQLSSAQSERDNAAAKAKEYEDQRKAEQEIQVSQQLNSLRSGSTVSGSAGPGLGSLSSGRSSYSVSTGGKSGGVLDRAYKDIDPTDSVLNKDVAVASATTARGSSGASSRTEARQRALAAGGSASDYYARRFG